MHRIKEYNYVISLISIINFLMSPIYIGIFPLKSAFIIFFNFLILIISGLSLCTERSKKDILYIGVSFFTLIAVFLEYFSGIKEMKLIRLIITIVLFAFITYRLLDSLLKEKEINKKGIFGAISGYLYLGLLGGVFFEMLDYFLDQPFKHIEGIIASSYSFYYFSFMNITTVGFGDIYPAHPIAQSICIVFSITGQVYLTVVMASFVTKFLSK